MTPHDLQNQLLMWVSNYETKLAKTGHKQPYYSYWKGQIDALWEVIDKLDEID